MATPNSTVQPKLTEGDKQFKMQIKLDEIAQARKNGYNVDDNGVLYGNAKIRKHFERQRKAYIAAMLKKAKKLEKREGTDGTADATVGA